MLSKLARVLAIAAFGVLAAAGPVYTAVSSPDADTQATGQCLAWLGARGTGKCIAYEMDGSIGPSFNFGGPTNPNGGFSTGPLLPGQTFTKSLAP
jgi:hypothetical protein